ncbi:hypothetical protein HN51_039989 [Arachis hypogaea]|uniref:RING-type E3 ubiquitin transferase n=1 Tax=Arachis hypogaea TaxID=3818 RepID=A0A444YLS8_ARAHY|nr:putative RING-H2 finger protein ATL53 [Arachis ipaensis]XP_025662282.1 putative RING-H2 finger protein ATL53 [Arachis hypogaea]QHN85667.1 RING-H2 finger protein [Arachis hypogaea]RYR02895.1 hypothetical protein Ahy_B06g081724 [Arachis hypogaea]
MMISLIITVTFLIATTLVAVPDSFHHRTNQRLLQNYYYYHHGDGGMKKKKKEEESENESDRCAVCLCQVLSKSKSKGERVRWLPGCNHQFHADCIGAWLKEHSTCPLCRSHVTSSKTTETDHKVVLLLRHIINVINILIQRFSDVLIATAYT